MKMLLQKDNIYAMPTLHYTMECAMAVKKAFDELQPDCVAVELPEHLEPLCLRAAERLPDISVIKTDEVCYLCEPCDPAFEGLRSAIEKGKDACCIDYHSHHYPLVKESLPDPYSILHVGLENYFNAYQPKLVPQDLPREIYMAKRLKELSFSYDKILFISGFAHIKNVLEYLEKDCFPEFEKIPFDGKLCTPTKNACRDVIAEYGWISKAYEAWREKALDYLDRQKLIYFLYKTAGQRYQQNTGHSFLSYHLRNTMKFVRNYALLNGRLLGNLFEILSAAKGCVDHNYAYEVWNLATSYPFWKNIDNLPEKEFKIEEIWGHSKQIQFHLKQKQRKGLEFKLRRKDEGPKQYLPPSPFSICSYPPEDTVVEKFGESLKKKGNVILSEEASKTLPFSSSLEDGIDVRETIRHFYENKLYVKVEGRPPGAASAVVVIFDPDKHERFHWKTTWLGEHNQESDMAFYATPPTDNIVGPGISRCQYGGFMMSSPPQRLMDVWTDQDYFDCKTKAEVLLMAAIDYAQKPVIIYVAEKPPRQKFKSYAARYGKKLVFVPIGQLSPAMLNKIRIFHVLDGHDKREIAGEYIF